jgi:ABC-2 type transport system permease protein
MAKLWAVIKREYLERVRTKWFIISTIFGPILLSAIMVLPAIMTARSIRDAKVGTIEIVDITGLGLGTRIAARIMGPMADTGTIGVRDIAPAELAAAESLLTASVMREELSGYLVVDSATVAGQSARYAGRNASSMGEMDAIEAAIRAVVLQSRLEAEGLDPVRIESLTRVRVQLQAERITEKGRGGSGMGASILGFIVAFLLYMMLILYGQNILRSVLEEKTTRVAEVIVASVKPDTLLAGKVFGVAAVSLTQQVVWLASGVLLWSFRSKIFELVGVGALPPIPFPEVSIGTLLIFILLFILGFLFYAALFAAAGATVNSDQEAQQASQPIMMLLIASIVFLQPIMLAPTSTMAKVLSWLPFSAPIVMPLRMSVVPIPALELTLVLLGLAVSCVGAIWLSSRIYRVGLLMYGKRPSLRELGRWVLQS